MTPEATDFLYPFIEADERDPELLLVDLARSAGEKWTQSTELRADTLSRCEAELRALAAAMADRFTAAARLFVFGNGGSATDADGIAQLYTSPPWGRALPALSLSEDYSVITAVSNDVGFDKVFLRQLNAHGHERDIAMGISTSGNSENLLVAFAEARRQGMLTIGLSGYDGGRMAADAHLQHCIVARSQSVHRIQEAQASATHVLWAYVQQALTERATR